MSQYTAEQWREYRARNRAKHRAWWAARRARIKAELGPIPTVRVSCRGKLSVKYAT